MFDEIRVGYLAVIEILFLQTLIYDCKDSGLYNKHVVKYASSSVALVDLLAS